MIIQVTVTVVRVKVVSQFIIGGTEEREKWDT